MKDGRTEQRETVSVFWWISTGKLLVYWSGLAQEIANRLAQKIASVVVRVL